MSARDASTFVDYKLRGDNTHEFQVDIDSLMTLDRNNLKLYYVIQAFKAPCSGFRL